MPTYPDNDFTLVSSADNTKHVRFSCAGISTATERVYALPYTALSATATLAAIDVDLTWTATQQFNIPEFRDASSGRFVVFDQTLLTAASRTVKSADDDGVSQIIVAPSSATVNKTGQTASIASTGTFNTSHAGLYRMSAYAVFTAVTTPGNLSLIAKYTDPQQAQTITFNRNNTIAYTAAGSEVDGQLTFYATNGSNIAYQVTLTGVGTYNVYIRVESLT